MFRNLMHRMHGWLRQRIANTDGTAAVEFAFIFPILLSLYLGSMETSNALIADRKVTNLTSTLADLVSQSQVVDDNELNAVFNAGNAIMAPYPTAGLSMTITSVEIDPSGNTRVDWSVAQNATPHATNSPFANLPVEVAIPDSYVIVAEVSYSYDSFLQHFIQQPVTLTDVFYLRPRTSEKVDKI